VNKVENPVVDELEKLDADIAALLTPRDSAAVLLTRLPERWRPGQVAKIGPAQRAWELSGLFYFYAGRYHEALAIFWRLYQHMLAAQPRAGRVHKGMPLVWISDCFGRLGFPVHAKRYLMLTLCEDALREKGNVSPETTGAYFRLVWGHGLRDSEFRRYAGEFWQRRNETPETALFPEALLQRVDDSWRTEIPSPTEAFFFLANEAYVKRLVARLGDRRGETLELLAEYLLSCMPGCRTQRRQRSGSTDYDIVCAMEGPDLDFRSELGRHFVCECKDWSQPADFTTMAKFCRVLDSTKARFGILFSRLGISGQGSTSFAEREQLKVFQDRAVVIVVLDRRDLEAVASGANFISLLRERYEAVRLDLSAAATLANNRMLRTRPAQAKKRRR
jgi:hypothetical protein